MLIELLKVAFLGIVEGITEWLPVSSTGHMILVDEFLHLHVTPQFKEVFLVVIQLGAILAVLLLFWRKLFPFVQERKIVIKRETVSDTLSLWGKIIVSCIPAAIIGVLFDHKINDLFYNWRTVAIMLVVVGIVFIIVENKNKNSSPKVNSFKEITYMSAFLIGIFQLVAAVFPGTSRSGATIIGALMLGVSRTVAAEYTFLLAIPVMFGASALKLYKSGLHFSHQEYVLLIVGMAVAFLVSIFAIRFLMNYIKRHDFKIFGYYRIVLGVIVLAYFLLLA